MIESANHISTPMHRHTNYTNIACRREYSVYIASFRQYIDIFSYMLSIRSILIWFYCITDISIMSSHVYSIKAYIYYLFFIVLGEIFWIKYIFLNYAICRHVEKYTHNPMKNWMHISIVYSSIFYWWFLLYFLRVILFWVSFRDMGAWYFDFLDWVLERAWMLQTFVLLYDDWYGQSQV